MNLKRSIFSGIALASFLFPSVSALEIITGSNTATAVAQSCVYSYTDLEHRNPSYSEWVDTGAIDGAYKEQSRRYSYTSYAQDYDTCGRKLGSAQYNGQHSTNQTQWVLR